MYRLYSYRFFILFAASLLWGGHTVVHSETLVIYEGSYTTATLNDALNGYDSLTKSGTDTTTVTLSSTLLNTNLITVSGGVLEFTNSAPSTGSTAEIHVLPGTLHIHSGAEAFLNAKDALGYTKIDTDPRMTIEVAGTLRLRNGVNQTMRSVTLDMQGGTVTGGEYQYRSNVSVLKATSGDSTFTSTLTIRSDATAPVFTVSKDAALTFTGTVAGQTVNGQKVSALTLDGEGKTVFKGAVSNLTAINITNGTLELASGTTIARNVPEYNIGAGGTLYLSYGDILNANGTAVTLNVNEGGTLQFINGANQTARNITVNLTGAALTGGNFLFMSAESNATGLNVLASATASTISSTLLLRYQGDATSNGTHIINVEDGAAAEDLKITGTITSYNGNRQNLTFSGAGTVALAASSSISNIAATTLDGVTLVSGKNNALYSGTNLVMNPAESTNGVSTLNLNGFSQSVATLTGGTGILTNGSATKSVLTLTNGAGTFKGTIGTNIDVVKNGSETWNIAGSEHWGASLLDIQAGTVSVNTSYTAATGGRFLTGNIVVRDGATLKLATADALGGGAGGSVSASGLTLDVLGTLSITGSGNQTSRYMNYNLYGGTIDIASNAQLLFMHNGTTPVTTIHSGAAYNGNAVAETSRINGRLTVRDSGVRMTLDVEDGGAVTDLWWTGTLKKGNNPVTGAGEIYKTGAGTLRLSNNSTYTSFDHTSGTTVAAGTLVLDAANVTGSSVTVNEGASFYGVNDSSVTGNLTLDGNYELNLADLALYADAAQQLSLGSMTFGETASASVNLDGEYSWEAISGVDVLTFDSAAGRDAALTSLATLLNANPSTPNFLWLSADGASAIALNVNLAAVPEPSTWILFLLGAGLLGVAFRKR